jgi:hypothetical protein
MRSLGYLYGEDLVLKLPEPIRRREDGEEACLSRATGCGGQRPQVEASSKYVKEKRRCVGARKPGIGNQAY